MTPFASDPADLVLHGPRVLGFARSGRIAAHFGLDREFTDEALLDFEANGWVTHSAFAGNAKTISRASCASRRFSAASAAFQRALASARRGLAPSGKRTS